MEKNKVYDLKIIDTTEYLVLIFNCSESLRISTWYKISEDGSYTIFKGKYSFFKSKLTANEVSHLCLTDDLTTVLNAAHTTETVEKIKQIWNNQYYQWLRGH